MSSPRAGDVDGLYVAGDGELAGHDVLDGVDGGAESARHAQQYTRSHTGSFLGPGGGLV